MIIVFPPIPGGKIAVHVEYFNLISKAIKLVGWLVGFYGVSTLVGYLMPNPAITNLVYKGIDYW